MAGCPRAPRRRPRGPRRLGVRSVEDRRELEIVTGREAVELQVLALLDVRLALGNGVRRDPRRGEHLREVRAGEPLYRPRVGHLVDAAAHEQVARQRPRRRVVDHLVDLELVVARAGLEKEVVGEVLDEIARRRDVVAVPGLAVRILHERGRSTRDEMLRVEEVARGGERVLFASTGEHRVDRGRDELDVPELLGGDVGDQVEEGACLLPGTEVERLVGVVHEGRHLAELAAQQLLDGGGAGGVGSRWRGQLGLESVDAQDHLGVLLSRT